MSDDVKHGHGCTPNGKHRWDVFLDVEWPEHRREHAQAVKKIDEIHMGISAIRQDTKHLHKLDTISTTLTDLKEGLIEIVSGKNVVDVDTMKDILKAQQHSYTTTISTICKIFGVIIIILVGMKVLMPHWFQ